MTQDAWLTAHPYLLSVAEFHSKVEKAAASLFSAFACVPNWNAYEDDYLAGVPLLRTHSSLIDLRPAETMLETLIAKLVLAPLPDRLAQDIRNLQGQLRPHSGVSQGVLASLRNQEPAFTNCGLLRFLGWTVMSSYLSRVVDAFGKWRDEEHWLRRYCPTCGSLPAMAQLVGIDPGRVRLLSCGCCRTRWQYRRMGCPSCENQDDRKLTILEVEGEKELRIDRCESCGGYIKTYNGSGCESLLLADWTSLHLDVIAQSQGLNRSAASLYEL